MSAPMTQGQRLAAQAAEAAEVRDWQTHPDVVALRVEKARGVVDRFLWTGMVLGLLFTMTNVQQFAAHTTGVAAGSLGWWAAWLLDPTVSLVLLGILLAERHTSRWQVLMGQWTRIAKWALLAATYVMNTWQAYTAGNPAGIVLHSVPPLVVFMGAEAVTDLHDKLTEAVHRAHAYATNRAEHKAKAEREKAERDTPAEQTRPAPSATPVPLAPPAPAPFRVVPIQPDTTPPDRSAERASERSADRSDPSARNVSPVRSDSPRPGRSETPRRAARPRTHSGTPRTDAQLSRAVRELAEQTGAPPSQYAIKQRLGVGSGRAARLLADLDTTPTRPPETNGATRKDGAR
jgi:hypothetical protein